MYEYRFHHSGVLTVTTKGFTANHREPLAPCLSECYGDGYRVISITASPNAKMFNANSDPYLKLLLIPHNHDGWDLYVFKKREKHNRAVRWGKNKSRGYGSVAYNTEGSPIPGQASAVFHLCTVLLHHYNGLLLGCKWGGIWQNAIKAISKQFSQTDFFRAASGQLYWGNVVFYFPLPKSNNKRVTLPISQQQ